MCGIFSSILNRTVRSRLLSSLSHQYIIDSNIHIFVVLFFFFGCARVFVVFVCVL